MCINYGNILGHIGDMIGDMIGGMMGDMIGDILRIYWGNTMIIYYIYIYYIYIYYIYIPRIWYLVLFQVGNLTQNGYSSMRKMMINHGCWGYPITCGGVWGLLAVFRSVAPCFKIQTLPVHKDAIPELWGEKSYRHAFPAVSIAPSNLGI